MAKSCTLCTRSETKVFNVVTYYAAAAAVLGALTGCASWTQPFFYRPVVEDNVKDLVSTVSLAADRRSVMVLTAGPNKGLFCAEPPPDSATSLAAQADLGVSAKKEGVAEASLSGRDQFTTAVTVMADRTPSLDGFRIGIYALCQYRINGMIKDEKDFTDLFRLLIEKFSENIKAEASRSPRPVFVGVPPPVDKSTPSQSPQLGGSSGAK